ncbi:class I SAM-dependent methyltransferase [Kitasatospora sp. MAP5-34]|uniref:class I SAM-dependent methyltransferase n=1 Tax=Kitasatospora sp. MAP5-34 TaxID=3035102 RepID=UPI002476CED0|nr:class I SAM-dependent methyltransferase [Kitasatospora sp. MAP5-34]MDH6576089.1 SAM-dependent methyltransferase [Kitasatospora sp. MAP5-34]
MTQYDALAARLADIDKAISFYRENVEFPSFFRALGPVDGKRVLDMGCGDGLYARMVAQRGAEHVVGMDSSGEMIRLAEVAEAEQPLGIQYHVHDMATMPTLGSFDLVIAVNVLHYADSRATLDDMCKRISSNLAPGGRLLAYVGNAECDTDTAREFGFIVDRPADAREGDPFTVTIPATPPASVEVHYWSAASLAQAVESAGFTRVCWEEMIHSPVSADSAERLGRLLKSPTSLLLSAYKE